MVRSKSEVIIANMLHEREVPFTYEEPLFAEDGTLYLPDFTVTWRGEKQYWEHWGRMDQDRYRKHTEAKKKWYKKFFPGKLVETLEGADIGHPSGQSHQDKFHGLVQAVCSAFCHQSDCDRTFRLDRIASYRKVK